MCRKLWLIAILVSVSSPAISSPISGPPARAEDDSPVQFTAEVILEKLPLIKQERLQDFQAKINKYLNEYDWLEKDDAEWMEDEGMPPFKFHIQLFLKDRPSNIEDRYRCNLVLSGSDIQYVDERATFAFQEGEALEHDGDHTSLKLLLDFYVYLAIANEFDKMGFLEGTRYFKKARTAVEQGQFDRFILGWDRRKELMEMLEGENYKKFREMKDYFFYSLATYDENKSQAREYMLKAMEMLREIVLKDRSLDAAKDFISAHYQEVIDMFKHGAEKRPIEILHELDPDRRELYEKYLD